MRELGGIDTLTGTGLFARAGSRTQAATDFAAVFFEPNDRIFDVRNRRRWNDQHLHRSLRIAWIHAAIEG